MIYETLHLHNSEYKKTMYIKFTVSQRNAFENLHANQ
uniref:Uncharacterized protein n=1 Tax=Anguilla anguilla TaxID=7936 RepID=A0A0E9UUS6_ANGAN